MKLLYSAAVYGSLFKGSILLILAGKPFIKSHFFPSLICVGAFSFSFSAAISNVKIQAGSGAEIISCKKGYAPDGISCWIVVVAPITNGSTPEQVTYYSGYQFCYSDRNDLEPVAAPSDGQNPIMNFIGTYTNGRATMTVSCTGKDQASIYISWSSNVAESSVWTMSGPVTVSNDGVSVTYTNCTKQSFTYSSDGELISSTTDYENGNGSFDFLSSDYNAYWYDAMENAGAGSSFWFAS